jgi:PmbA protein
MADDDDGKKRNDSWYTVDRFFSQLESPEDVGRIAAQRALTQLGARKVNTREVPVVWENRLVHRLLGIIARAASGEALYRRQTFLMNLEGEPIASPLVTVIDDPLLPRKVGSRPFDGEGVTSRRNELVVGGVFRGFLFDSYTARKTGRRTTGSATRGVGGPPGVGTTNLSLITGESSFDEILGGITEGLFLTDLMGFGVNMTTGDFSQGAAGRWIENGRLSYPVSEVNVSGNLREMLLGIEMVGNDPFERGGTSAPTIRMGKLMVSGL